MAQRVRITVAKAKWNTTSQSHSSKMDITKKPRNAGLFFVSIMSE
jgi:hypothetical protein